MTRIPRLMLLILVLTFGLTVPTAWAQQVTGSLEGRVVNIEGEAIAAVNIIVSGPSLQGERLVTTDERGAFRILALPVGDCTLTLSHAAYQGVIYENVSIPLGKRAPLARSNSRIGWSCCRWLSSTGSDR